MTLTSMTRLRSGVIASSRFAAAWWVAGWPLACSEQSICPESCRADFESRIGGLTELPAQIEAFEAVYIDDGAPCLPPADEVQP